MPSPDSADSASPDRFRAIVEAQSELISLSRPDGEIVYAIPSFARQFGLEPDPARGHGALSREGVRARAPFALSGPQAASRGSGSVARDRFTPSSSSNSARKCTTALRRSSVLASPRWSSETMRCAAR